MAMMRVLALGANGRALNGASVSFYDENASVVEGAEESGFVTPRTVYSDAAMTVTQTQPVSANNSGEAVVYIPSLSQIAVKVSRTDYVTRWTRRVDVTGSDPV